ncbi:MAG: DUF4382 domain-containing protein [Pseudomonadota bacterium]
MKESSASLTVVAATTLLLAACGGGSSGSSAPLEANGSLTVQITDAPVDGVTAVTVEFTGLSVKPASGDPIDIDFATPLAIDLATLTGENTADLITGESIPAGAYEWVRLNVNADCDAVIDSYVDTLAGGQVELSLTDTTGLQISDSFTVNADQTTSLVIDWDLRRSLVAPSINACYQLLPTLRVVDRSGYGVIQGTVASALVEGALCTSDPNSLAGNVVYVYEGANVTPDDIDGNDPDPVTTANVVLDINNTVYSYTAAFLEPGDYTVAFTCNGLDDRVLDPSMPSLTVEDDVRFSAPKNVTVTAGAITEMDMD